MSSLPIQWLRILAVFGFFSVMSIATDAADDVDPEEAKEKTIADRFGVVLDKNPRRGTALDKVYGYHVERGSLEGLISGYREKTRTAKGTDAGPAWMLVGLLESLRGQDAMAVAAFEQAEKLASDNYLASYYLGQSLILIGQPDKAAEALERSIQRKPAQADLLDVYQALGRVYQRAQKTEQALDVWNRLEKQFPNDARVQEQIATTLLEENEYAAALPRFEALAKNTKDKYRQSLFQMEAAEIKVRLGKSDQAIKEFETLLGQLLPENWLYREVRRRIEAVYLRTDDQAGLISYYETWVKKYPKDLEAISRLSRLLSGFGRGPEAQTWLENGLKIAPTKKELRQALISQFVYEQKYAEAISQYEQLDKYGPNNPDTLRDWGRLILKDTAQDEVTRKQAAAAVWRRLTDAKPKDALVASQVGELFRQAEMTDEALELYNSAIKFAPDQAQYREYLGEYFHALKRKDEALSTWREIAAGNLKTAPNLARLAEVLASFGYLTEAVAANAEACQLDPKDFSLQVKRVDLLAQADKHDEALQQLATVKKLAANDEEREAWLVRDLRELQAADKLKDRIAEVAKNADSKVVEDWFWLARAYEAERQMKEAGEAVTKAGSLAPQSVPILMASARIFESQNNLLAAVEINTKLAAIDRRYRTEYLKQVATLEQKLGRKDKAIQAGRDLIAAAPGNPELYEFFSQLCFQLGENDEGLGALRRSVRVNPTEPKGLLLLASALSEQFRTSEAIELYWRAFDKAANLEDRLGVMPHLTELYLRTNQLDRLLERLERQRREPNQQREMTICLAQAYQSAGDDGNARQELEKLLTEDTRDVQLLTQLVKLCETDGDLDAAVKFQQQILKSAPGKDGTMRLAQLLMRAGESEEASQLLSRITLEEKDPEAALKSLDSMLNQRDFDQALRIASKLSRDQPKNWELLYREGIALARSKDKAAEANEKFAAIIALNINDDELSLSEKQKRKKAQGRTRSPVVQMPEFNPLIQRVQHTWQIRQTVGLDNQENYGGMQQQQPQWMPQEYGVARMACLGWMYLLARNDGKEDEFTKSRREIGEKSEIRREIFDWYYFSSLMNNGKDTYNILKKLSLRPDADADIKSMYLSSLSSRATEPNSNDPDAEEPEVGDDNSDDENNPRVQKLPPLSKPEIEHVMACYKSVDESTAMSNYGEMMLQVVAAELKRAGRKAEADKMLKDAIDGAKEPAQIGMLLGTVIQQNDYDTAIRLLDRLAETKENSHANPNSGTNFNYAQYYSSPDYQSQILAQLMDNRAQKKVLSDVLVLWDRFLPTAIARLEQQKSANAATKKRNQQQQALNSQQVYVQIWRGRNQQHERLDFPSPNEIYDQSMLQMLRQAFVIYKEADKSKDLLEHFQRKNTDAATPETQKVFWQFGLGYLYWWLDDKDDALNVLTLATDLIPDNSELKFALARLHEKRGEHDAALQIVDSLATTDQQAVQKREIAALRMAVNSGNIERARLAAERLFGLRLDSNLQIQLAQQMHQLGMHEQAEAVLARAGRQAGNKTDVLASLMQQYQSQGKNDVATQIAHQLLRRSVGGTGSNTVNFTGGGGRQRGDASGLRQQALIVLKRSGKLPEMIAKVEGQLKNSPKSQRLNETLLEYYTANGDDKKVQALSEKMAESKQDDPQFRYNLGQQLMNQGKHKEAVEHFKVALKKQPRLMQNNIWQVVNAFQNANKEDELSAIFEDIDLKIFRQNPWELSNVISNLTNREKSKDRGVQLFKRAWKDLPDQRQLLLQGASNDVFWQMPEIYDYARQGLIPTETSVMQNSGWPGFGQIQSWGNEGKITTLMNRFLTIATTSKKLDELTKEVEEAKKKVKKWEGADALLALIDLRRGKIDEARPVFEKLLPSFKGMQQGQYTRWEIGQELMPYDKCADLAIKYLESACKDPDVTQNGFQYTPGKPLVALYKKHGRMADARRIMLEASMIKTNRSGGNNADYEAYQRVQNVQSLGNEMMTCGFPVDALRLYQQQLSRTEDFEAVRRMYGGSTNNYGDRMKKQIEEGFQKALKELKPESLPELLSGFAATKDGDGAVSALEPTNAVVPPIDLLLLLETRELSKTQLSSALGQLVAGLGTNPEMIAKTQVSLEAIHAKTPDDFAALILEEKLAFRAKQESQLTAIVQQIVDLVDKTPLEPQPAKGGFTGKQREDAMRQVALWLVARDCLQQESLRAVGQKLGERALEASRRQVDSGYTLAILREWGQLAVDSGDPKTAEIRWGEMLEVIIPKPLEKPKKQPDLKTSERGPGRHRLPRSHFQFAPTGNAVTNSNTATIIGRAKRLCPTNGSDPKPQCVEPDIKHNGRGSDPFVGQSRAKLSLSREVRKRIDTAARPEPRPALHKKGGQTPSHRCQIASISNGRGSDPVFCAKPSRRGPAVKCQVRGTGRGAGEAVPPAMRGNVVTLAQFEQASQIAKLAAENGLNDLSVKAMTMALQAGPPIESMQVMDPGQGLPVVRNNQAADNSQLDQKVEERLTAIEQLWRRKGVANSVIYGLLKDAVLPNTRQSEVFIYPRPLSLNPNQPPQSVGALLVKAAVEEDQVDEIKQLIETRLKQPLGEVSARVLLIQLAIASRNNPLAIEQMELLSKRLQQDSLQNSSELACHVAIPAMSLPELPSTAIVLLERAVGHFSQNIAQRANRGNATEGPMRSLRFTLARMHFEKKNVEAGKKQLEDYLNDLISMSARNNAEYGQYRRRTEMMKVAAEYARAGLRAESLDCLGRYADVPVTRNYGQEWSGRATATILAGLARLPPAERYDLLKTWSLPTPDRKSVRMVGGLIPGDSAPEIFDALRGSAPRGPAEPQLMSTAELLISAARETMKLDELKQALAPHAEQNVENAKFLWLMTSVAKGEGPEVQPALQAFLDERKAAGATPVNQNNPAKQPQLTDIVLAHAIMQNPRLLGLGRDLALQFVQDASRVQDHLSMTIGRREFYSPMVGVEAANRMNREPANTGLKHWTAAATVPARTDAAGAVPMWWIAHEGMLAHICGPDESHLYLKYPLSGNFKITCDSWLGGWGENNLGYGGVVYGGLNLGSNTQIFSVGNRSDAVRKPDPPEVREKYNRSTLDVQNDKVRYFVNDHLIHEEPRTTHLSPWLLIQCSRVWYTVVRELQITGQIDIPRQVVLSDRDSLLGWVSDFYAETQPNRDPNRTANSPNDGSPPEANPEFDWLSKDGVIRGRIQPVSSLGKPVVQQSRLYYDRPLLDREKIQYEFWFEKGAGGSNVAPALGRLAFPVESDGVKLHWMTDGSTPEDAYTGLAADNQAVDKTIQRGKVTLKDKAWNAAEILLKEGIVKLSINGSIVCERPLEPDNSCQFGFYHDKNATSVQVRNVTLSGDWPKTLSTEMVANLFAKSREQSVAERRGYGNTLDEKFFAEGVESTLGKTRALPPDAQYEALKSWVLPNDDHPAFRLYGTFTATNGIPSPGYLKSARIDQDRPNKIGGVRRQIEGGDLCAPAFDLVDVAKKSNRLDELAKFVDQIQTDSPLGARSKLAIQTLIAIASSDFARTIEGMNQMKTLCAAIPEGAPVMDRWPELLVGVEAMRHLEYRSTAMPLFVTLVDNQHKRGQGDAWENRVCGLRDQCKALMDVNILAAAGVTSPGGQWIPATIELADAHARAPVSRWQFRDQDVTHIAGEGPSYLYFQSPLRGKFEVEADVGTNGWRETRLLYHGHWVGPQHTKEVVDLGNLMTNWQSPKITPKLEFGEWCHMKLVVEPSKATYFMSGRQVHEQALPEQADPWFGLMTWSNLSGGARSIQITGQPEIPDELNLSDGNDLFGWAPTMYGDPMGNAETAAWTKTDEAVVGKKFETSTGRKRQSLLRYHRPLLEDSVVDYDFFYVPGETLVHPALGRMAFLLDSEGVKLHWLTDAQWDQSGLPPDNSIVEPQHRRGPASLPLKKNDWNHIQLTLVGDAVKLVLNNILIYESPVALTNQRQLGLFHYADETEVQVKNVKYRGDWPKTLPSLKEQELSGLGPQPYEFADGELATNLSWDFQGPKPDFLNLWNAVKPNRMEPVPGGLKMIRAEKAGPDGAICGFIWGSDVKGDFEATLSFRDFTSKTEQPDWQVPRVEMFCDLGGGWNAPENTHLMQCGIRRHVDQKMIFFSGLGTHLGNKYDWKYSHQEPIEGSSRLRIVRKGDMGYLLQGKAGSDEWLLVNKGPVSDAPLKGGTFCLRAEMPTSYGEVVFTEFTLKTRQPRN